MAGHKIKLQSSDGDVFDVDIEIAKQSTTIRTMLEGKIFSFYLIKIHFYFFERSRYECRRRCYSITKC